MSDLTIQEIAEMQTCFDSRVELVLPVRVYPPAKTDTRPVYTYDVVDAHGLDVALNHHFEDATLIALAVNSFSKLLHAATERDALIGSVVYYKGKLDELASKVDLVRSLIPESNPELIAADYPISSSSLLEILEDTVPEKNGDTDLSLQALVEWRDFSQEEIRELRTARLELLAEVDKWQKAALTLQSERDALLSRVPPTPEKKETK